ncbi:hypothetical protein ABIB90_000520 [Bradyrhizobium sp. JR4.1]|uniref:hypothetical protein n=1 Tax=Bradyrhizobium sp. JR4.1 TaxID=3156372 RepID=UPI00339B1DA8
MMVADEIAPGTTLQSAAAVKLYRDIACCESPDQLDAVGRLLWGANAEGHVSDDDATFLAACIQTRRPLSHRTSIGRFAVPGRLSRFLPRRPQRSSDRRASRDRRRTLGGSSALPDNLRHHFTEGQRAVLCVIAGEIKRCGICDFPIDKIAALAGVCRTTVQNAIHEARRLGLLKITERPQPGRKNLSNLVEIVSREWLAWIKRGPSAARPIGSNFAKTVPPTKSADSTKKGLGDEMRSLDGHGPPLRGVA